jgi:hypothetical protein
MFGQPGGFRRVIQEIAAKFREKGANSPATAMTAQELGLPPRFEEAMKRRLGATGIFVQVGAKYYLDEARLQQIERQRGAGGEGGMGRWWASRRNMMALRMVRMVVAVAAVALALSNVLFVQSTSLRVVTVSLFVLWIALTVFQLYYLSRIRSRMGASGRADGAL